jgi:hypothetical protein
MVCTLLVVPNACAPLKNMGLGVTVFCRLIARTFADICSFVFQRIDISISVEMYILSLSSDSKEICALVFQRLSVHVPV